MKKKVIIGDGQYQREEEVETKQVNYSNETYRDFIGDTEFDGHRVLWGFEYFPTTYLKSSELSGDEYRKGGEIRYFKNRKQVYSDFCREPLIANNLIGATLLKLMDFNWDLLHIGAKVWYRELPCVIYMICEEQGCVVLKREDGKDFPNAVWHDEGCGAMGEGEDTVKVEIISESIYWYRK